MLNFQLEKYSLSMKNFVRNRYKKFEFFFNFVCNQTIIFIFFFHQVPNDFEIKLQKSTLK